MAELESGQSLASRFTLIRRLGRGGMGDVWLARDENLGTQVVTKIVPPGATSDQISLLRQECRNARRLSHPNIVRVFDFHAAAAVFISMEYVEGGDIAKLRGREPREIIATLLPLVQALEYAHGEGVVHRDLKSSNILLDLSGRPRLSDFGIAGVLQPDAEDLLLSGGGSRNHASPQQRAGEPPSPLDDVFGLGALLTEILGSSPPLPEPLLSLLQSMMAPAVADRASGMTAVREALEEIVALEVEDGTVAPQVVKSEIRLSPPPRVAAVRPSEPMAAPSPARRESESPSDRHPYWWLTVTAFLALAAMAAAVFVVLPKWVEERESKPVPVEKAAAQEPVPTAPESVEVARPQESAPTRVETGNGSVEPMAELVPPVPRSPVATPAREKPQVTQPSVDTPRPPKVDRGAREFAAAMSAGLKAYEGGDLVGAKGAFERALSLAPESVEAADGLARTELALRLEGIREHQEKAADLEREERWSDAAHEYSAALALDPTLRFAREGKDRAVARAALNDQLEYHITHPERLSEDSVLEEARTALASAKGIEPTTEKLQAQADRLQGAIKIATTPIRVLLVSDDLTQVVVYRVGRLGTFERRHLDLRPGTYTVVGTRDGFRDIRRQLEVVATGENKPMTVRCEEKI